MTLRYLIDTNIVSEPTRPAPDPRIMERLRKYESQIAIATVVWHELLFGCVRLPMSKKRRVLERYVRGVVGTTIPILSYDSFAAEWHANERGRLAKRGHMIPFADGQIAGIAATQELILVTSNLKDFREFSGLRIEDWRS